MQLKTMMCDYSDKQAIMVKFKRSFSKGAGSILSLQGSHIQIPLGSAQTDAEQLRGDWETVGREIRSAYKTPKQSSYHGKTRKNK